MSDRQTYIPRPERFGPEYRAALKLLKECSAEELQWLKTYDLHSLQKAKLDERPVAVWPGGFNTAYEG